MNFLIVNLNSLLIVSISLNIVFMFFFIIINYVELNTYNQINNIKKFLVFNYLVILIFLTFIRLYIKIFNNIPHNLNLYNYSNNILFSFINVTNGGYLSDILVLIAIIVSIVSLWILNERSLTLLVNNLAYFSIFITITQIMVYSANLLVMFIAYELLFLPTLYFALKTIYTKNGDKAIRTILYWTFSGSFLVLMCISYIYYIHKTLNIIDLLNMRFTELEAVILFFFLLIGFGVKIPIFPFYFWITKIHVETSTGYSMFLSGFLVKAAIYCLYFFVLILNNKNINFFLSIFILIGIIDISVRLWTQTDIKKLIAYCTAHEMSLIFLFLLLKQNSLSNILIIFFLFHSIFSCMMFFIVDNIQKRYQTRSIVVILSIAKNIPSLVKYIWIQILYFTGFPLTIKFYLEIQLIFLLYQNIGYFIVIIFILALTLANIGFCKVFLNCLYGVDDAILNIIDRVKLLNLTKSENNIFIFLNFFLLFIFLLFIII